ncbi:MAG: efflux RND transporter periplasmic adaptor subunit [Dehalobacterium sp.]
MKQEKNLNKTAKFTLGIRNWSRRRKWIFGIVIILIIIGAAVFFAVKNNSPKGLTVSTAKIQRQDMEKIVVANGRLDAVTKQEFFAPVDSIIMDLSVEVGDAVKKGQNMGRLDTLELKRSLEEANAQLTEKQAALAKAKAVNEQLDLKHREAQYHEAQKHLERTENLYQQGAVTEEALEEAKTAYAGAEKEYREVLALIDAGATESELRALQAQIDLKVQEIAQAEERLSLASFTAADDGVVLFVGGEKGNQVTEGTRLIMVGNTNTLEVTANINEMDAGSLEIGQPVKVKCAVLPEKEFQGEVSRVSNAAVTSSNQENTGVSLPVTVRITGDTTGLKLGFTVDLFITTMKETDLLSIPVEGIVAQDEAKFVFVIDNGVARKREIKTTLGNELNDIVVSGLKEGEEIILNPAPELQDGQKVVGGKS